MDSLLSRIWIHICVGPLDPHHTYIARVTHCVPSPMWILNDVDTTLLMQDISCFLGKPVREWRSYHQQQMLTVVYPQLTIFYFAISCCQTRNQYFQRGHCSNCGQCGQCCIWPQWDRGVSSVCVVSWSRPQGQCVCWFQT